MKFELIRSLIWEQTFVPQKSKAPTFKLEDVGNFISGRTPKADELSSSGNIPYFKISDMNSEGNEKFLQNTSLFFTGSKGKVYPKNTIVYPKNGGAVFTNKRRLLVKDSVVDLNTGGFVCGDKINVDYAYKFLCGLDFRKFSKGTTLPTIDQQKLRSLEIQLPSKEEQEKICFRLEKIFSEIYRAEKAYQELQTLSGVLRGKILQRGIEGKLVPQLESEEPVEQIGDVPEDVPFAIPEKWKWTTLNEVGTWKAGGTPSRSVREYYENGTIPWLKTGDLTDGVVRSVAEMITLEGVENSSAHINPIGAVLIAMYGATIGKLGVLEMECATNQACCACVVREERLYNWYLFYYLLSQRKNFIALGAGGAQPNISRTKIIHYPIPLPPLEEQKRIVSKIEELLEAVASFDKDEIKPLTKR